KARLEAATCKLPGLFFEAIPVLFSAGLVSLFVKQLGKLLHGLDVLLSILMVNHIDPKVRPKGISVAAVQTVAVAKRVVGDSLQLLVVGLCDNAFQLGGRFGQLAGCS